MSAFAGHTEGPNDGATYNWHAGWMVEGGKDANLQSNDGLQHWERRSKDDHLASSADSPGGVITALLTT